MSASPICPICRTETDGLASLPLPDGGRIHRSCADDMRAIYSAASRYLRTLYADQPSPHATKDNSVRLARIAEALHGRVACNHPTGYANLLTGDCTKCGA